MHQNERIATRTKASPRALVGLSLLFAALGSGCVFELADVVPAGAGGSGGQGCASAAALLDTGNLAVNPSFEAGLSGWTERGGGLKRVEIADAPHGRFVARVTYDAETSADSPYSINDETDTVESASIAGATYRATAWVRSAASSPGARNPEATVSIILKAEKEGSDLGEHVEVPLGPCFTKIETSGVAKYDGDSIGVHVSQYHQVPGDAFDIDLIQVVRELPDAGADGG